MKDLAEVCPLSRGMMLQSLSPSLQEGLRFFRIPVPAASSVHLAVSYPEMGRLWAYHVPRTEQNGLGPLSSPVALDVHERSHQSISARYSAILAQACQHLRLVYRNDVYQAFTYVDHAIHPGSLSALMLADTHFSLRFDEQSSD